MQNRFSETLNALREEAGLTITALARRAKVPITLICGLEKGSRRVGEANGRQIGEALGLTGEELDTFVLQAMDTSACKVLKRCQDYPSALVNLVTSHLHRAGILPNAVTDYSLDVDRVTLLLDNGRKAQIETVLTLS